MPKFVTEKTFKLDYLGPNWKDCYIKFESTTINETRELIQMQMSGKPALEISDFVMAFFAKHFIDGVGYDAESKKVIPIKKEELGELPSLVQEKMITFLVGDTVI